MYRSYFYSRLTVLSGFGSKPFRDWDIHCKDGYVARFLDPDIRSTVLDIRGTNVSTTYMSCPKGKAVLGIALPYLVMIVKNLKKYFTFEVIILDNSGARRRFRVANFQSTTQVLPLSTVMPIDLSEGWNQIQFNLYEFTKRAYHKDFVEVQNIKINANIRLQRLYFTDRLVPDEELPPEYKLYFPFQTKSKNTEKTQFIGINHDEMDKTGIQHDGENKENAKPSTSKEFQELIRTATEIKCTKDNTLKDISNRSLRNVSKERIENISKKSLINVNEERIKNISMASMINGNEERIDNVSQKSLTNVSEERLKDASRNTLKGVSEEKIKDASIKSLKNVSEEKIHKDASRKSFKNVSEERIPKDGSRKSLKIVSVEKVMSASRKSIINPSEEGTKTSSIKLLNNDNEKAIIVHHSIVEEVGKDDAMTRESSLKELMVKSSELEKDTTAQGSTTGQSTIEIIPIVIDTDDDTVIGTDTRAISQSSVKGVTDIEISAPPSTPRDVAVDNN